MDGDEAILPGRAPTEALPEPALVECLQWA